MLLAAGPPNVPVARDIPLTASPAILMSLKDLHDVEVLEGVGIFFSLYRSVPTVSGLKKL
jgi:hypothetical protein